MKTQTSPTQLPSYIFIGRAGAGKGTQAQLLTKLIESRYPQNPVLHVETGAEFRKFLKEDGFTQRLSKQIIDAGGLMPEFMPVFMWGRLMVDAYRGNQHLIFDGTPRKLLEAQLLDSLFPFYGLAKPFVVYLDITHEESVKRLTLRAQSSGRADDDAAAIERRQKAFEADVLPTIEWYRTNPHVQFLDVNGIGSIEAIHADIVKRVGLE